MVTLVTGFGPFLEVAENASWAVAQAVAGRVGGVAVELPTSFARAAEALGRAVAEVSPTRLVLLGVARSGGPFRVEGRAAGVVASAHADIDGVVATGRALGESGAPRATAQDAEVLAGGLRAAGLAAEASEDCGGYVCNSTYHAALGLRPDALFLHIPPETDAASLARAVTAVEALLAGLAARVTPTPERARHRLHLLGLAGGTHEVAPGYQRGDARLRKQGPRNLPAFGTVAAALGVSEALPQPSDPYEALDRAWFATRDAAEASARAAALGRLGAWLEAAGGPTGAATADGWLVLSGALRPLPALAPAAGLVAAHPETAPSLLWLGRQALAHAARLGRTHPGLDPELARFVALMRAATEVASTLPTGALDALLTDLATHLLAPQHRGSETEALLFACRAAGLLLEHPAEFERMVHGFARRRPDRIHRALLRQAFVRKTLDTQAKEEV
jgi:pyroglutamyl-peptidase